MTAKSSVKSATRVEQGKRSIAALPRDPATGRILPKAQREAPPPAPAPAELEPRTPGGGATAPALPTHGFLARHRRRSAS